MAKKRRTKKSLEARKEMKSQGAPTGAAVPPELAAPEAGTEGSTAANGSDRSRTAGAGRQAAYRSLVQIATSLWYVKTKHFRQAWDDTSYNADDPRDRRALGRLEKAIEALGALGVDVNDPTHSHYPTGGEALMRPIEFTPTDDITEDVVTETAQPIVYIHGTLAQRAEVFVAVPNTGPEA